MDFDTAFYIYNKVYNNPDPDYKWWDHFSPEHVDQATIIVVTYDGNYDPNDLPL